ncbi:MAG: BatA and WFA domain-containing protein [Bacillota bacterium]|nr:BatA and WFA domain-containing protein [Bacillota bacterium]
MSFFSLWPLAFFILIPLIILMYLLKQKTEDKITSSLFLWKEVYKNVEASTPWEKLKKNIMLILQILIVLFLIISLMNPFLLKGGKEYKNVIIVLDNTGSMNASYGKASRFDEEIKRAQQFIDSLKGGANIVLISCGSSPKIELANSSDKGAVIRKLKSIKTTDTTGSIEDSFSLVKSIAKQMGSYEALFITDKDIKLGDINGTVISLGNSGKNASIDVISHKKDGNSLTVMIKVTNRGNENYSSDLSLYGEDKLLDIKNVELKPKESKVVYFQVVPYNGDYLKGVLSEQDMLSQDNTAYDVLNTGEKQKILLVSEKNIFLEKAFGIIPNTEVFKAPKLSDMNEGDSYNLYVFDGVMPDALPKSGNIIFVNPPDNKFFKVGADIKGGTGTSVEQETTKYLGNLKFSVESLKNIELPPWGQSLLKVDDKVGAFMGKYQGREIVVFAFDLHKTDLVLKPEFPILINNLSSKLMDNGILNNKNISCGYQVQLNALPEGGDITVKAPDGKEENISVKSSLMAIRPESIGLYSVSQKVGDKKREALFAMNFPSQTESDVSNESLKGSQSNIFTALKSGGINLQVYLILLALIILIAEWLLYLKGY